MATIRIDEINTPKFDSERYIEEYFKPMQISKERKEERQEAAKDFRDVLLFILALISVENGYNALDWAYIEEQFRIELERAALQYARVSQALNDYIAEKASDFVAVTQEKDLSDPYWTSDERATYEAVNEANDVVGLEELQKAIDEGYTHKVWKTENDTRVRKTHRAVEGKKIPIKDMFEVGNGLMRYPHDWYYNAKECYNCRCACVYTDKDGKVKKTAGKVQYTNENGGSIIQSISERANTLISSIADNVGYFVSNNRGGAISDEEQQRLARAEIRRRIDNGRYSLKLSEQKYLEHVEGTPQYKLTTIGRKGREPSRLNVSYEEAQRLIDELSATGRIDISRMGVPGDIEYITLDRIIGDIFIDGEWKPTKRIAIHHGNDGSHIVPVRENPRYE